MTDPTATTDRQPHDTGAERAVLGCMMLNAELADDAIDIIHSSADFYTPTHASVYAAITAAHAANEPTDPTVIASYLDRSGELARIPGGAIHLSDLVADAPISMSIGWYARKVAECATRRRLIAAGMRIVQ